MEELTELESSWSIWSGETGVDMDQVFADFSTPQQWCDAGVFPGDHELFIVQGFAPEDVQSTRLIPVCPRLVSWLAIALIELLGHLEPCSAIFNLVFKSGRRSLKHLTQKLGQ